MRNLKIPIAVGTWKACHFACLALLLVVVTFGLTSPAHAYLDPGTASIAIQAILAALAGAIATIKLWGHRIKSVFARKPKADESDKEEE